MKKSQTSKEAEKAGEKIVKTTLRVPQSLWTRTRIRALQDGIAVQDLVIQAITEHVKKGGKA